VNWEKVALGIALAWFLWCAYLAVRALIGAQRSLGIIATLYLAWAEATPEEELQHASAVIVSEFTGVPVEHVRLARQVQREEAARARAAEGWPEDDDSPLDYPKADTRIADAERVTRRFLEEDET
jgi:hypothetical protein